MFFIVSFRTVIQLGDRFSNRGKIQINMPFLKVVYGVNESA